MKRLKVVGVRDLTFGRHDGRNFDGFDAPFVVVHGPNESGKSTLAEFLVWSIGGPWRSFAQNTEAFRRGSESVVSGRFLGVLDGDAIDIDARFELKKSGTPKDLRKGTIGVHEVDAAKLAERLGALVTADYKTIYRLYGADLGDIGSAEAFSDLFSQFALGSATVGASPRQSLDQIRRDLAAATKEAGSIRTHIKNINKEIVEASRAPELIKGLEIEQNDLDAAIVKAGDGEGELAAQKALLERVRSGYVHVKALDSAESELATLPTVSDNWVVVADNLKSISELVGQIKSAEEKASSAADTATRAAAKCGLDPAALEGRTLTPPERVTLSGVAKKVLDARGEAERLRGDLAKAGEERDRATSEADRLQASLGLDESQVLHLDRIAPSLPSVRARIDRWVESSNLVITADAEVEGERARRTNLGGAPAPESPRRQINPIMVIAALVAVGVLGVIHWAAGLVAAVVLAGGVLVLRGKPTETVQIVDDGRLAEFERKAGELREAIRQHRDRITETLGVLDSVIVNPDTALSRIDALAQLAEKRGQVETLDARVSAVRSQTEAAIPVLTSAEEEARSHFSERQVPFSLLNDGFDTWLATYEQAVAAAADADSERRRLALLEEDFRSAIADVKGDLAGLPYDVAINRIESVSRQVAARRQVELAVRDAKLKVAGANMDSPEVSDVLSAYPGIAELDVQIDLLAGDLKRLRGERDDLIAKRTEIAGKLEELRAKEVLAGLALRRGQLDDDLAEVEARVQALELAHSVLGDVIDRYERENQDPVVATASSLISGIVPDWGTIIMSRNEKGEPTIQRHSTDGRLGEHAISDGGRALLYLGIRLAFAAKDAERRGIALPIICDDPLVHFDDDRQLAAVQLLKNISANHQVVLFTCEQQTLEHAVSLGATAIRI